MQRSNITFSSTRGRNPSCESSAFLSQYLMHRLICAVAVWALAVPSDLSAQVIFPSQMPSTPMPSFKGCSDQQENVLRQAWRRAHYFTWRANRVVSFIRSSPNGERSELWNRDLSDSQWSPAVKRWFGSYDNDRAAFIDKAIDKAEARFEMRGEVVKGITTIRCGSPIAPAANEHTDICPAGNPGGNGAPSAYHAPVGTIVTCPSFWNNVNNGFVPFEDRLNNAAKTLVHELFHWLSVDSKYVVDRHADGAGGHEDKKYYGLDNVTYLAKHKPSWAIRNNDTYAFFARAVGLAAPSYNGLWIPKESPGTGGFFHSMTWDELVDKWKALDGQQYLADVESYVVEGKRKFLALWRIGTGNGALYLNDWHNFSKTWGELKDRQELIDIETYPTTDGRRYLGIWRLKPDGQQGDGGLLNGLSWDELVAKWKQFADVAYLADVETYVEGDNRKYIGVWRIGGGQSALFQHGEWDTFAKTKVDMNNTQQMIDYDRYQDLNGNSHFVGVWRTPGPSGPLHHGLTLDELVAKWQELKDTHTLIDIEVTVPLAAEVK